MYNNKNKIEAATRHYDLIRDDLQIVLKEAMTSDKDYDIVLGFDSSFKPFVYKVVPGTEIDYYDSIIFNVRNSDLDILDYFKNDLEEISKITGVSIRNMRNYTAELMGYDPADIEYNDIINAIQAPGIEEKLKEERARRINGLVNLKELATNILDNWINFNKVNYIKDV
jgi:hypothetical protein